MKAWVYRKDKADNGIHIFEEDVPTPRPGPEQILVRVEKVSVCGTDEQLFRGDLKKVPDGIVPGHEFYGEIVELGANVSGFRKGQKIAAESHYHVSGTADQGIIGLWGAEIRKGELLPALNGGYAEYTCIPFECAHLVPGELISDRFWPSLFEAIGNDFYLIKRVKETAPLRAVGIFGCGPHGLFAQVFARYFEIPRIAAFETDSFRREFASKLGAANQVFDPVNNLNSQVEDFTGGMLFDATLDMVGKQGQGFESCCETTRDGGTVFLFGLFSDRFAIDGVPGNEIIFKMRTVTHEHKGKRLQIVGITGREGVWKELIQAVSGNAALQDHLMKPVHVMGTLRQLGDDTRHPKPGVLKRAYHAW